MKTGLLLPLLCSLLLLLFGYTALSKLLTHEQFEMVLLQTPFLRPYASILSWAVPLSEIVLVVLLLLPRTRFLGFVVSAVLLILFTGYLALMLVSGMRLPCSCGGVINGMGWGEHLVMNLAFVGIAVWGGVVERRGRNSLLKRG